MKKIDNYHRALAQLSVAVESYTAAPEDALYRDGLIQRFEFTVELAWKSLKEYLEDQGMAVEHSTPKAVLKDAFSAGIIQDDVIWIDILNARNLTSHIYDEVTAIDVATRIRDKFLPVFQALADFYKAG